MSRHDPSEVTRRHVYAQKGLSKKPDNRFRDAHEFLAALGGTAVTVAGQSPSAGPLPLDEGGDDKGGFFKKVFGRK